MNIRAARRKAAALINGVLISTVHAKLVPAIPKSVSCKRIRSAPGETLMVVSKGKRQSQLLVRNGTSDWMTFDQIFIDEDYDLRPLLRFDELRELYQAMLSNGETPLIIDLGANVGFSAVYFHLSWPEARIVAVEPDPDNVEQLIKNTCELGAVDVVPSAIASHLGELQIKDATAQKNAVRVVDVGCGSGRRVTATTIPEILRRYSIEACRPFIVKVDIEGGEENLFAENVDWIDSVPLLIVELHDWLLPGEQTSRTFLTAVSSLDRDFVHIDENVFSIRNRRGSNDLCGRDTRRLAGE